MTEEPRAGEPALRHRLGVFHRWEPWRQYVRTYQFTPGVLYPKEMRGKWYDARELRQRRRCSVCGKMQDESVMDDY